MKRYAAYRGGKLLAVGTNDELSESLNITPGAVRKLSTPKWVAQAGPKALIVKKLNAGQKEYAAYRGEEFLGVGTVDELSEVLNVKPDTVRYLSTPAYRKIREKPKGENRRYLQVIKIEPDEEELLEEAMEALGMASS